MDIRQASSADDLAQCAALNANVQSTHVWQLRLAYDSVATQPVDEFGGTLHCTRLPRPIILTPASAEPLDRLWERAAEVLVAEDEQGLAGYIVLIINERAAAVTVERLVVAPLLRRGGIGGQLIRAAGQWSSEVGFDALTSHCAARNHPTVSFYQRHGFRFAGYSEAFYPRGEVALFWNKAL